MVNVKKYVPSKDTLKKRATTVSAWELPKQTSALAPPHIWTNKDMDPTPIEDQTWTLWTWMVSLSPLLLLLLLLLLLSSLRSDPFCSHRPTGRPTPSTWELGKRHRPLSRSGSAGVRPFPSSLSALLVSQSPWFSMVPSGPNSTFHSRSSFDHPLATTLHTSASCPGPSSPCSGWASKAPTERSASLSCSRPSPRHTPISPTRSQTMLESRRWEWSAISSSGLFSFPSCSSHQPGSAICSLSSSSQPRSQPWQQWAGAFTKLAVLVSCLTSQQPSLDPTRRGPGSAVCLLSPEAGQPLLVISQVCSPSSS
jgi:hypothetical protein